MIVHAVCSVWLLLNKTNFFFKFAYYYFVQCHGLNNNFIQVRI